MTGNTKFWIETNDCVPEEAYTNRWKLQSLSTYPYLPITPTESSILPSDLETFSQTSTNCQPNSSPTCSTNSESHSSLISPYFLRQQPQSSNIKRQRNRGRKTFVVRNKEGKRLRMTRQHAIELGFLKCATNKADKQILPSLLTDPDVAVTPTKSSIVLSNSETFKLPTCPANLQYQSFSKSSIDCQPTSSLTGSTNSQPQSALISQSSSQQQSQKLPQQSNRKRPKHRRGCPRRTFILGNKRLRLTKNRAIKLGLLQSTTSEVCMDKKQARPALPISPTEVSLLLYESTIPLPLMCQTNLQRQSPSKSSTDYQPKSPPHLTNPQSQSFSTSPTSSQQLQEINKMNYKQKDSHHEYGNFVVKTDDGKDIPITKGFAMELGLL